MGRQALSAAEKQARLLKIFSGENKAKQHFFNKAELEKIGDKEQGITPQSVMEQVDMLVADNLVDKDKLGSAVLFWALPSTSQHKRKRAKEELDTQITKQQADVEQLEARQAERDAKRSKGMSAAERAKEEQRQQQLENQRDKLQVRSPDRQLRASLAPQ